MNENMKRNGTESVIKNSKNKNLILFVLCLIGAFGIWIYAMQADSPEYEETFSSIKVELINTTALESGAGLSIFSGYDDVISVTLVGTKSEVTAISAEDITATADVSSITEAGTHAINIMVNVDGNVFVKALSKNSITVYADENETIIVKIEKKYRSVTVPTSYELGEMVLNQDTVTVSGPKTALDQIHHALVSIDAGYLTTSITAIGQLALISESGREINNPYIKMSISSVNVTVPVYTYKEVPLTVAYKYGYFSDANEKVTVTPATVRLKGDPVLLENYDAFLVTTLDEKMIREDLTMTYQFEKLRDQLPEGVVFADEAMGATVSVDLLEKYAEVDMIVPTQNIKVTGAPGVYSFVKEYLTIKFRGPYDVVSSLGVADISLSVNLSEFSSDVVGIVNPSVNIQVNRQTEKGAVYELGTYDVEILLNG